MHDVLRFWLDRGVDGFRMDVVHLIGKDPALPDDPRDRHRRQPPRRRRTTTTPGTHALLRGIRARARRVPGDRMMVGEVNLTETELIAPYFGDGDELHLAFNFPSLHVPWERRRVARSGSRTSRRVMGDALADLGALQPRPAAHAHAPGGSRRARAPPRCCC